MNKPLFYILLFTLLLSFSYAVEQDKFDIVMEELLTGKPLSAESLGTIDEMDSSELKIIIDEGLNTENDAFWEQFVDGEQMSVDNKNAFLYDLGEEDRQKFMDKYGERFDIGLEGFGSTDISLREGGRVGGNFGDFDMNSLQKYNSQAEDKIARVEYRFLKGKHELSFIKESGAELELESLEGELGFHFDVETGRIGKMTDSGDAAESGVDYDDLSAGVWNGRGLMSVSTNEDGITSVGLGFTGNPYRGKEDPAAYARFERANGEAYSAFRHPTGFYNDDGTREFNLLDGNIELDQDGNLITLNNVYKDQSAGKSKWGGFYGADTSVAFDETDYATTTGSKVLVDLEKGIVKTDIARVIPMTEIIKDALAGGYDSLYPDPEKYEKTLGQLAALKEALDPTKISEEPVKSKTARDSVTNFFSSTVSAVADGARDSLAPDIATRTLMDTIAPDYKNLPVEMQNEYYNSLKKFITEENGADALISLAKVDNDFKIGAALGSDALSNTFSSYFDENPSLGAYQEDSSAMVMMQLPEESLARLKDVEMTGGRLFATDRYGVERSIVEKATNYGYHFSNQLNSDTSFFRSTDVSFSHPIQEDGRSLRLFSDPSGDLQLVGVGGDTEWRSVNGEYVINAGAGVSYRAAFGLISGSESSYENVLRANNEVGETAYALAQEKKVEIDEKFDEIYRQKYREFESNALTGNEVLTNDNKIIWTKSELNELRDIKLEQFAEYNDVLYSDKNRITINSDRMVSLLGDFDSTAVLGGDPLSNGREVKKYIDYVIDSNLEESTRGMSTLELLNVKKNVANKLRDLHSFLQENPSSQVVIESNRAKGSEVFTLKAGNKPFIVDKVVGGLLGKALPAVLGHAKVNSDSISMDLDNSRWGSQLDVYVNGGQYEGIGNALWLKDNAGSVRHGLQQQVTERVISSASNPGSPSTEVTVQYPSYYTTPVQRSSCSTGYCSSTSAKSVQRRTGKKSYGWRG